MFKVRTTLPTLGDKLYNNKSAGGLSTCINGKCKDTELPYKGLNVLANCVGWGDGRFNEVYNEMTGYTGMKYPDFNCNASKFIEYRVKNPKYYPELQVVDYPVIGGILVMDNGGDGHVMIVEQVLERDSNGKPSKIFTSESGWNGVASRNVIRDYSNNHWGMGSTYSSIGCIVNPAVGIIEPTKTMSRDTSVNQLQVLTDLYVRADAGTEYPAVGMAVKNGVYNYYDSKVSGDYTWYRIADNNWVAQDKNNTYLSIMPKQKDDEDKIKELENQINELNKEVDELQDQIIKLEEELEKYKTHQDLKKFVADKDGEYCIHLKAGQTLYMEK